MRVADWHTYFVGAEGWRFSVWAHNLSCDNAMLRGFAFVARQFYTVENLIVTRSWSVARAAARLGLGLTDMRIANGVAHLGRIGNASSLRPADMIVLARYLVSQGANQIVVRSGVVLREELRGLLGRLATRGHGWPGLPGSQITQATTNPRTWQVTLDLLHQGIIKWMS